VSTISYPKILPFTGSHLAAILPLLRWGLPPSALVIGSVAPDLPYYLPLPIRGELTHSLLGGAAVDVPLGAAAFLVWQALLGPACVALAPAGLRRRLDRLAEPVPAGLRHLGSLRRVSLLVAALTLGVATHLAWDSFTHDWMWGAHHIAWLAQRHGPLPGYEWAQYVSTVAGAVAIAAWCGYWWRSHPAQSGPTRSEPVVRVAWALVGLSTVVGTGYGVLSVLDGAGDKLRDGLFFGTTRGIGQSPLSLPSRSRSRARIASTPKSFS
jgi:Domain of unknown function (DUF4184)